MREYTILAEDERDSRSTIADAATALRRIFCGLTDFRSIAIRGDRMAGNVLAVVYLVTTVCGWLRVRTSRGSKMSAGQPHIQTEVYLDFLGRTIPVRWDYHAILMVAVWFVLVPICILVIRFGKPKPTLTGIREKVSIRNIVWWWFSVHKYGLIVAVSLALAGAIVAVTVSGGLSGSLHSIFGIATVALGCLQIMGGWLRGVHGGKNYYTADPYDPKTWFGDHYNMTTRRRIFEAYHKTAGYFVFFFAAGAVTTGVMQYPISWIAEFIIAMVLFAFVTAIVLEYKGYRYDGYRAAHGYTMDAPFNKEREFL
jgi:hypothetical protein